mgnify:CR=1 FL=1
MSESKDKFQQLLSELFQFDLADLDFGIYRIMNHKRQVIERWITEDLPRVIQEELSRGALAEQQQAQQALEEASQKVLETLGEDAIDAEGNLAEPYSNTKVGREYLEARDKAAHAQPAEALEAQVYNHLYTFFSRYYQDGDFISKRRYSKKERYAIPYNGEEVYLYWANHDQYYVKTAEHFTDYTWKAPNGVTVHFKLQAADVEVNNVKGEKRFFLPVLDSITWDEDTRTLTIPFHYRPLTEQENITYGNKNQQEKIIAEALEAIPAQLKGNADALAALSAERRKDAKGNPVSYLEHHLRQYTARNTRDFFIHKGLKGFLSRELDFYLKNEVLNLDELEAAGEGLAEGWFQLMRLIKRIGNHIIDFLAQIEDFQKALWEKKKFVTETFWCVTVGHIPEDFYPEIAENEAQWQEWRDLFHIHELPKDLWSGDLDTKEGRIAFLKAHPTLVLDTRHFPQDFTDRLLASFDNLDEMTDGLLVHAENWQALNLILEKYRERVKCIYIDPPYNTDASAILYKNDYKHSSWLSLMFDRLVCSRFFLSEDGISCIAIDDTELHGLAFVVSNIFGEASILGTVCIRANPAGRATLKGFSIAHDYALFLGNTDKSVPGALPKSEHQIARYSENDEKGRFEWVNFRKHGGLNANRNARPKLFYPIYAKPSGEVRIPEVTWDDAKGEWVALSQPDKDEVVVYPINSKGEEKTWKWGHVTAKKQITDLIAKPDSTGKIGIYMKSRMSEGTLPRTLWIDKRYSATDYGTNLLTHILGNSQLFSFPKSVYTVQDSLRVGNAHPNAFVLDYFAGSGTTGHAVINLNREDGGRRKFILVEMGEYFDTVLLPRIKKVTFTPEWKDGEPKRMATQEEFERGPRIVKVIRLESYEDALNNITFDEESGQKALDLFGDEYLLRYMLRWESKKSETLLDVEQLQAPFSYKLRIHRDGETREQPVDLPETFAYLIGLDVEKRQVLHDGDRRYLVHRGTTRDGRKVAVIWREIKDWTPEDFERDAAFVAEQELTVGANEIFVNGDSYIEGARSLDGLFKARLFGQEG